MKIRCLLLCLIALPLFTQAQESKVITIAADYWCPFNCQVGSDKPGYMIEIAQRIFAQHNIKVSYKTLPWSRALKLCRNGDIHAVVGGYKSDAPDFIYPDNEQGMIGFSFFNLASSPWKYDSLSSLSQTLLAIAYDYAYSAELGKYIKKHQNDNSRIHIAYGDKPLQKNIMLLEHGLVDVLVETEPVFWYVSQELGLKSHFRKAGQVQKPLPAYIAFSPALVESERYAQILSSGMEKLRSSGELARILARYGLKDWQEK